MQKGSAGVWVVGVIALILIVGGGMYYVGSLDTYNQVPEQPLVADTLPAKKVVAQQPAAPKTQPAPAKQEETKRYASNQFGFTFSYPASYTFSESVYNDGLNVSSWSLSQQVTARPAGQAVDCGARYPDDFSLGWSIADLQATSPNLKIQADGVRNRYDNDPKYSVETHGGTTVKVQRNISGMCADGTEVLLKDPAGRYILAFSFSSDTKREADIWKVIGSFQF